MADSPPERSSTTRPSRAPLPSLLHLQPRFVERVWGGDRLSSGSPKPIGEVWIVGEDNPIVGDPAGRTLGGFTSADPQGLVGQGWQVPRFPLLIKLIDTTQWLSVQVHPNDEQARRLEGPDAVGKTEAWHILEADDGASLVAGLRQGVSMETFVEQVTSPACADSLIRFETEQGDTFLIPAGTVHAIGPGVLLYEVQQASDITYRLYDWGRPAAHGRELHLAQALQVASPEARVERRPLGPERPGELIELTRSDYFVLERLQLLAGFSPVMLTTRQRSFHAVTVVSGSCVVHTTGSSAELDRFDSVLVPAQTGSYAVVPGDEAAVVLISRLPR